MHRTSEVGPTKEVRFALDVETGVELEIPAHDIDVVRGDEEIPCFVDVARCEGDEDGDREGEPKEGGMEEIVVIAINGSGKPSGRDDGVDGLPSEVSTTKNDGKNRGIDSLCTPTRSRYRII